MNTIYIVRHGETINNRKGIVQGRDDSPLTQLGKHQVKTIASCMQDVHFDRVICSPTERAYISAEIICTANDYVCCETDNRIKEYSFGDFEGISLYKATKKCPDIFPQHKDNKWKWHKYHAESYQNMYNRISDFLLDYFKVCDDILIVGHELANKVLIGRLMNLNKCDIINICHPHSVIYHYQNKDISIPTMGYVDTQIKPVCCMGNRIIYRPGYSGLYK